MKTLFLSLSHLSIWELYGLSIVFALIVSVFATYLLKKHYGSRWLYVFLFFFLLNIAIPLLALPITAWIVFYLLYVKPKPYLAETEIIDSKQLKEHFPVIRRIFGEGSMIETLKNPNLPTELKIKALSTLADSATRESFQIIKVALADRDDQVRLLSFSVIDKMEKQLTHRLHQALNDYEKNKAPLAAKTIAQLYWELIYYELSSEDLRNYILEAVFKYSSIALSDLPHDPSLHQLLGKAALLKQKYDLAADHFLKAIEFGATRDFIIPYLAEIYFHKGDFPEVKRLIAQAGEIDFNNRLYPIAAMWRHNESPKTDI